MRRGIAGLSTAAFSVFALLQLNDPDPVRWFAIYAAAAVATALEAAQRGSRLVDGAVAGVATVWAIGLVVSDQLGGEPMHWGPSWGPLAREGMREFLGLSLVATGLWAFAALQPRAPGARAPSL